MAARSRFLYQWKISKANFYSKPQVNKLRIHFIIEVLSKLIFSLFFDVYININNETVPMKTKIMLCIYKLDNRLAFNAFDHRKNFLNSTKNELWFSVKKRRGVGEVKSFKFLGEIRKLNSSFDLSFYCSLLTKSKLETYFEMSF